MNHIHGRALPTSTVKATTNQQLHFLFSVEKSKMDSAKGLLTREVPVSGRPQCVCVAGTEPRTDPCPALLLQPRSLQGWTDLLLLERPQHTRRAGLRPHLFRQRPPASLCSPALQSAHDNSKQRGKTRAGALVHCLGGRSWRPRPSKSALSLSLIHI